MALKSATINVIERAARKAARSLVRDFGELENLQVSRKGPADFVSAADLRAEEVLRGELGRARPGFGFLMEESGEEAGSDGRHRWIVDPLDGTTNFLHSMPHFAISVALEADGEIVAGAVYEPVRDELFWAEKGQGAWLNDRRLRVSGRARMADAVIATGIPFRGMGDPSLYLPTLDAVIPEVAGIRRFGSAALDLAWVAAGRFDGFWEFGLHPWDVAAGILLVREAGGFVTEISGRSYALGAPDILAGNGGLHGDLVRLVDGARRQARRAAKEA